MGVCTVQNLENDYMRCCPTDAKGLKYSAVWCVTAPGTELPGTGSLYILLEVFYEWDAFLLSNEENI